MVHDACPDCEGQVSTRAVTCPRCGSLVAAKAAAATVVNTTQLAAGFVVMALGVVLYFTYVDFLVTMGGLLAAVVGLVVVAYQLAKIP